ncbi:MAG TPA: TetR/AcrR family transcriptional regulator [Desulfosalsimonadaceae bacterium]|nr:TetR/AcrR family transcriptional regulator [Desulfosalsimonadaceae bacterium]
MFFTRSIAIPRQEKINKNNGKYQRILNAAIKIFAEQGFYKATISQVAREAGVADGTIYIYFKNKADILNSFFNHRTREVFQRFRETVEQAASAEEKLRNLIRRHLYEFQRDRNMAVVFQREALQARYVADEYIKDITKMYLDILEEVIALGQSEGSIRPDFQTGLAKRFILGAVNEVINSWVTTGGKYDLTTMADPLVDLYLKGIASKEYSNYQH